MLISHSWKSLSTIKYLRFLEPFILCRLCNFGLVQLHAYPSMLVAPSQPLFRKVLCIFSNAPDSSHLLPIVFSPHPSVKLLFISSFLCFVHTNICIQYTYTHLWTVCTMDICTRLLHLACTTMCCFSTTTSSLRRQPGVQNFSAIVHTWLSSIHMVH